MKRGLPFPNNGGSEQRSETEIEIKASLFPLPHTLQCAETKLIFSPFSSFPPFGRSLKVRQLLPIRVVFGRKKRKKTDRTSGKRKYKNKIFFLDTPHHSFPEVQFVRVPPIYPSDEFPSIDHAYGVFPSSFPLDQIGEIGWRRLQKKSLEWRETGGWDRRRIGVRRRRRRRRRRIDLTAFPSFPFATKKRGEEKKQKFKEKA